VGNIFSPVTGESSEILSIKFFSLQAFIIIKKVIKGSIFTAHHPVKFSLGRIQVLLRVT
jgi:hypothetical protein